MSIRERLTLTICIGLHVLILWNVWQANKHTPRVVHVDACELL